MAKTPAFVLPAGLEIDLSGDTLSLGFDGDVQLEQSLGRNLADVYASGNLVVKLPLITGAVRAGGLVELDGKIECDVIHGREVVLGKQDIKCRAISADERIVIGAAKLAVDIIIAPEIVIDPKASGRVTVIESRNERGATKIKGGFSLKEYEEIVGDTDKFLADRGLTRLGEGSAPAPAAEVANGLDSDYEADEPEAHEPPPPEPEPEPYDDFDADVEEEVDDPLSLSVDDLEPLAEPVPAETEPESDLAPAGDEGDDELHPKLIDAVKRISACYEGKETPPAVHELKGLVESRDYDRLRENITEVWNGLLGFHQKKGIRPHHQVTHAFNVIHGLVQQQA